MPPSARRRRNALAQAQFSQKVNQVQQQPTVITPSAQFIGAAAPMVPGDVYWRMGKGAVRGRTLVDAPATSLAQGNSVVTSDPRGQDAAYAAMPSTGYGINNQSPFPARAVFTPHSLDSAGMHARTAAFQHGRLISHERGILANRGTVTSSANEQRTGANPNPEADGPARPAWKMVNRTLSHMYGSDSTRNLDNHDYHATVMAGLKPFPLATQGQEWSVRNGGTPYLANYRPYGTRGGFSAEAPLPTVRAESGGPYRPRTLLQVGDPGDGPQKVYGGLPWGLHSPTLPGKEQTQTLIRSRIHQVKPVWNVRPSNSKTAGQSWSQSMVSLSGQQAVKLRSTQPIRQPGLNSRWLGV
jgi:hypothetical protein